MNGKTHCAIVFVGQPVLLFLPAGRLLLGVLAPQEAVGPLQQWHVLLFHCAVCPLELGPLIRHHTGWRYLRSPGRVATRGRHTVVDPFPRLAEELLFFSTQYAHPYHLQKHVGICYFYSYFFCLIMTSHARCWFLGQHFGQIYAILKKCNNNLLLYAYLGDGSWEVYNINKNYFKAHQAL